MLPVSTRPVSVSGRRKGPHCAMDRKYAVFVSHLDSQPGTPTGRDLRAQREAAGVTLRALALRSSYSLSYLSRVENGQRSVTPAVVRLYTALLSARAELSAKQAFKAPLRQSRAHGNLDLGVSWFGSEARRLRMAAGKSLSSVSAEVYLSRSYLGKIEQGDARGNYRLALALDRILEAEGRLAQLFLEESVKIGPIAPDTDVLAQADLHPADRRSEPAEIAIAAAARLETLRTRSHQVGPGAVLSDLAVGVGALYRRTNGSFQRANNPVWRVAVRYAELLGWIAQEIAYDMTALRWMGVAADWARALGDADAIGYTLVRHSQWARRHGDAAAAIEYARRAGAVPGTSARIAQFAAQREAQAYALSGNEPAFRRALEQYQKFAAEGALAQARETPASTWQWGPAPDPAFERSRTFEASCLVDLSDHHTAATLFDQHMTRLGSARTGYARLAIRQAIAYASIGEPALACGIVHDSLPTIARQGSASLRNDIRLLSRTLNRYRSSPDVRALLPDLAAFARAASRVAPAEPPPVSTPATGEE